MKDSVSKGKEDVPDIKVTVLGEFDEDELEKITQNLKNELTLIEDVEDIRGLQTSDMPGAKGDTFAIGTLVFTILQGATGAAIATGLFNWVTRDQRRSVEIKIGDDSIKLTGVDKARRDDLVTMFVARSRPPFESEDA